MKYLLEYESYNEARRSSTGLPHDITERGVMSAEELEEVRAALPNLTRTELKDIIQKTMDSFKKLEASIDVVDNAIDDSGEIITSIEDLIVQKNFIIKELGSML
jgi:glycine cleavage system regulatory protein